MKAIDSVVDWWDAAPEWQRRGVIAVAAALGGFIFGLWVAA